MKNIDKYGKYTGILSLVELGLGSFLHSLRIPFTGMFLSLNQIFILSLASRDISSKSAPGGISTTSAILKSLAPAGKKLTPMLAICAQGQLFSLGLWVAGNNFIGRLTGGLLSSLWSFIQPIAIYYILYGRDMYFMIQYFSEKLSRVFHNVDINFLNIFLTIVLIKILMASILIVLAQVVSIDILQRYFEWGKKHYSLKKEKNIPSPFKGALKDTLNPMFIISVLLMSVFYFFSNADYASIVWKILRPLALGFIIFYIIRIFPIDTLVERLKDGKYKSVLKSTINFIKQ